MNRRKGSVGSSRNLLNSGCSDCAWRRLVTERSSEGSRSVGERVEKDEVVKSVTAGIDPVKKVGVRTEDTRVGCGRSLGHIRAGTGVQEK